MGVGERVGVEAWGADALRWPAGGGKFGSSSAWCHRRGVPWREEEEGGGAGSRETELALLDSSRLDPTRLVATEQFTMGQ